MGTKVASRGPTKRDLVTEVAQLRDEVAEQVKRYKRALSANREQLLRLNQMELVKIWNRELQEELRAYKQAVAETGTKIQPERLSQLIRAERLRRERGNVLSSLRKSREAVGPYRGQDDK